MQHRIAAKQLKDPFPKMPYLNPCANSYPKSLEDFLCKFLKYDKCQ